MLENTTHNLLLADDDMDDCTFFKEALQELPVSAILTIVRDGIALMHLLTSKDVDLPDVLFLDLNMPRKTGFACLSELKSNDRLKQIPVIIFSTSFDRDVINLLYEKGAHYYIRKPGDFSELKKVIHEALVETRINRSTQPSKDKFVLQP